MKQQSSLSGAWWLSAVLSIASLMLLATSARAQESYYAANPTENAELSLTGVSDGTSLVVTDLETGELVFETTLDRYESTSFDVSTIHYLRIDSTNHVLAYLGYDCCGVGGTYFLPTEDGHARVGRAFLLYTPVFGVQTDLIFFALEDSTVYVVDEDGTPVIRRTLNAWDAWNAYPFVGERPYAVRSTGDIAIMFSAVNGVASVPPSLRALSCDGDIGRSFVAATHSWGTGGLALFAYESSDIEIIAMGTQERVGEAALERGQSFFLNELGRHTYRIQSSGDIAVWAGDMEGGSELGDLGDDFSYNLGAGGVEYFFDTQNHGATVFATVDDTELLINGESHSLDRDQWLNLEPNLMIQLTASAPVAAMSYGGNTLNDWGGYIRPVPRFLDEDGCPDEEIELPSWPDEDAGPDAGPDADLPLMDADAERLDSDVESQPVDGDLDSPPEDITPRRSCDCSTVGRKSSGRLLLILLNFIQ